MTGVSLTSEAVSSEGEEDTSSTLVHCRIKSAGLMTMNPPGATMRTVGTVPIPYPGRCEPRTRRGCH